MIVLMVSYHPMTFLPTQDGEWISVPTSNRLTISCCSCGLVHKLTFHDDAPPIPNAYNGTFHHSSPNIITPTTAITPATHSPIQCGQLNPSRAELFLGGSLLNLGNNLAGPRSTAINIDTLYVAIANKTNSIGVIRQSFSPSLRG